MNQLESFIRDYLASNLDFISDDFELIQAEYHLKNAFGTRGFIDILAQDYFQNFVIIEIKRSNQAARDAVQEVLKYAALLKQTTKIKESEIRICIISSEWDELLVPFSEFYKIAKYPLQGFKIYLNSDNIPEKKERIQPLENPITRNISSNHMVYLYKDKKASHKAIEVAIKRVKNVGIQDFVLLEVFCDKQKDKVIFPYGIYLAFQRYEKDYLKRIIVERLGLFEELEVIEDELESDYELINYLEQLILQKVSTDFFDTVEAGYPDKFLSLLENQGWKVSKVTRLGFFADDPRLKKDDIIISEIKGIKGGWFTRYHNYSSSEFKLRFEEIKEHTSTYLYNDEFNNTWLEHTNFAFYELEQQRKNYELAIDIYNPRDGILNILYKMHNCMRLGVEHPLLFMPTYVLQIHFSDDDRTSVVYVGRIKWNGNKVSVRDLVMKILKNDIASYFFATHLYANSLEEVMVMHSLGFEYSSDVFFLKNGDIKSIKSIETEEEKPHYVEHEASLYIEDFFKISKTFLMDLSILYDKFIHIL